MWQVEVAGRVATVTFTHPPRNLMTFSDMTELEKIVRTIAADESVSVLVIASDVPDYFVAHGDLDDLLALGRGEPFEGDAGSWPRTLALFETMPQIVIAAINGQAWGGGLELSLACTLRIAGPAASLGLCEVDLGLIPGGGGTQRLPRLIGAGRAAEMILTSRPIDADEALRIGLVQVVLPDAPFASAVRDWVSTLAAKSPAALRAAKQAIAGAGTLALDEGLALEGALVGPLLSDPEAVALQEQELARHR